MQELFARVAALVLAALAAVVPLTAAEDDPAPAHVPGCVWSYGQALCGAGTPLPESP